MKLRLFYIILWAGLATIASAQSDPVESLWQLSLKHNPRLKSQYQKVKASRKMVSPKSFPMDPMLKFSYMNQPVESGVSSPMSSFQIMASQNLPFPTKLYLRGLIQYRLYEIERAKYHLMLSEVKRDIQLKYISLVHLNYILSVEEDKLSKIQLVSSIAQTKYRLGKGLQQDLLKISVTELHTRKKIIKLKSMLKSVQYSLSYLIGNQAIETELIGDFPARRSYNHQNVLLKAQKNYPLLRIKQKMVDKAKAELALARWDYLPDLGINLGYNIRDNNLPDGGVDQFTVGISASVPVYSLFKQLPLNQSRKLSFRSAQEGLKDSLQNVERMVGTHIEMFVQDKEIVELYEQQILNESEQALDSSLTAYQVDKVDFLSVLNSLISLYQQQSEYYDVKANMLEHQTWLEYLQSPQKITGVENE